VILGVTAAIVSLRKEWQSPDSFDSRSLTFLVLSGIATGLSWLCYYRALQLGPASRVAPVDKLSVVLVMILAFAFLGEKISLKVLLGGLMIAAGSAIIAL
jgi:transporter family protein